MICHGVGTLEQARGLDVTQGRLAVPAAGFNTDWSHDLRTVLIGARVR
jgi:hypothetical protein